MRRGMLGTEGLEPIRESRNTQSIGLRFRAVLAEDDVAVFFHLDASTAVRTLA
jgi:hypothetical protein